MKEIIPGQVIWSIYENSLWCDLAPQYPGYQISNTGLIRSMKFYKKYPYGIILDPNKHGVVTLSNSLNQPEQVNIEDLKKRYTNFTIPTYYTDIYSRNPIITSQSNHMKNKANYKKELQKPSGFHFKTID